MLQYLKSVISIHPETVVKMYATYKMFYFVPLCFRSSILALNFFTYDKSVVFYLHKCF